MAWCLVKHRDEENKEFKVVQCFSLTENHAMKAYCGVEVWLHGFFDLGTRWR
jgi:hypothetical protein